MEKFCCIYNCSNKVVAKLVCGKHYKHFKSRNIDIPNRDAEINKIHETIDIEKPRFNKSYWGINQKFGNYELIEIVETKKDRNLGKFRCILCKRIIECIISEFKKGLKKGQRKCQCEKECKYNNKKFGMLTVIKEIPNKNYKKFLCQCDCGRQRTINITTLIYTQSKILSCKYCLNEIKKPPNTKTIGEISGEYWRSVIGSAKSRNLAVEVDQEYLWTLFLKQDKKCALTNIPLVFGKYIKKHVTKKNKTKTKTETTASLDRIDSSKGYIEGNLQWVHKHINCMKSNYTQDYFIQLCNMVSKVKGIK
jgi:hypothetical protein